jgi:hypothetical protein
MTVLLLGFCSSLDKGAGRRSIMNDKNKKITQTRFEPDKNIDKQRNSDEDPTPDEQMWDNNEDETVSVIPMTTPNLIALSAELSSQR